MKHQKNVSSQTIFRKLNFGQQTDITKYCIYSDARQTDRQKNRIQFLLAEERFYDIELFQTGYSFPPGLSINFRSRDSSRTITGPKLADNYGTDIALNILRIFYPDSIEKFSFCFRI